MLTLHDILTLGATGRIADVRLLLHCLPPRTSPLGDDAARAADAILLRSSPEDIAWLERHRPPPCDFWMTAPPSWGGLRAEDLAADAPEAAGPRAAVVALASMHPNGFVRERAVRLLAGRRDGGELPLLLVRVNDWVAPVREAAEAAVRARIVPAYTAHFVRSLLLVDDLRANRRSPHRALVGDVDALLCTETLRHASPRCADPGAP